jgi:cell pole-organizing protein PopZ
MSSVRTVEDYKNAIRVLLHDAEEQVEEAVSARDVGSNTNLSDRDMDQYLKGLDLLITEEATVALRAEFLRYSSVFDTDRSRETIRQAVAEITKPLIEEWINRNMATIAREVISEAIGQISRVRVAGSHTSTK